jgi:hypothetical protein
MLGEKRSETDNQVVNQITKMLEDFKNRMTLNNLRLSERYIKGELHIFIQFSLAGSDYVAIFERFPDVGGSEATDAAEATRPIIGDEKTHFHKVDGRDEQSVVLVGNVQFVESPEHVVSTSVRLGSVNGIYSTLRHALYSSMSLGMVFRGKLPDRESGLLVGRSTIDENELVGEMVKGTSEIVDSVPSDKSDFKRRGLDIEYAVNVISRLRIMLTLNSMGLAIEEPVPLDFQITDVLFGPFNFNANLRESFVSGHEDST